MTTIEATKPVSRLERRKARTRSAIMNAAEELFGKKGYEETSIAEIAEIADTGVGTVYGYFASKADILQAVLVEHSRIAIGRYEAAVNERTPHMERIIAALAAYAGYLEENRTLLRAAFNSDVLKNGYRELDRGWLIDAFEGLLRGGIAAGEVRDLPVQTTVYVLLSTYMMAFLGLGAWSSRRDSPELRGELETIVRAMLAG